MATTRADFRARIGRALGRRYYAKSTTTGTSTVNQIVDSRRTEHAREWDGASILVAGAETLVRGSEPSDGRLFLDSDLGSAPISGTEYELLKGFTFQDMADGIDWAHAEAYPQLYAAVDDTATTETAGVNVIALNESWRDILRILREDAQSSPETYSLLQEGRHLDYELRQGPAGLNLELFYAPETGRKLRVVARALLTIGAADASTSVAPWQVIVPGALAYLFEKGVNPDEGDLSRRFEQEAEKQLGIFEREKVRYAMWREPRKARLPLIRVRNDGRSTPGTW
ncbi:MAG: hypothetical protein ACRDGB_05705 [Candidatus Limnocylindria bacterium]